MFQRDVAKGIHRVEDAYTNWYLVEDGGEVTIVDAGLPASWGSLQTALAELGLDASAIKALVLTHGHFDHTGFAERARATLGIPILVHENDVPLTKHPLQYGHERSRLLYLRPQSLPIGISLIAKGALWPKPIKEVRRFTDGTLPVPGSPRIVFTPGHTLGHASLFFEDRDTLVVGDAIVTLDPYTGATGPRLAARAATVDSSRALASLDVIEETAARTLLTGHGEPWTRGAAEAVAHARRAGIS